jgi:RND family efflux transporter MFP subunit
MIHHAWPGLGAAGVLALASIALSTSGWATTAPQYFRTTRAVVAVYRPTIDVTGSVEARIETSVAFRIVGKVIERRVDVGSHVRAGDLLARIDDMEQRADVQSAEAGVAAAEANLQQRESAYARNKRLIQSRAISQADYEQSADDAAAARGALDAARATLAIAKDALAQTELTADADGIVTQRNIEIGQVVSAAQMAFTVAHDGPRDAVFEVFEAFFLAGRPEDTVSVAAVGHGATARSAKIREIAPAINARTGTIRVKAELQPAADWSLGTPVVGQFHARERDEIVLPWNTVTTANGAPAVWVVDPKDGAVSLKLITVLTFRSDSVVVAAGVAAGDLIVTEGGKFLSPGRRVTWEGP